MMFGDAKPIEPLPEVKVDSGIPAVRIFRKADVGMFFGVSLTSLDNWIRRGCPVISRGGQGKACTMDLLAVMKWKFQKEGYQEGKGFDSEALKPRERKEWLQGEEVRLRLEEKKKNLLPKDTIIPLISNMLAEIKVKVLSHHNTLASEFPELDTDVIRRIQQLNTSLLKELADREIPEELQQSLDRMHELATTTGESDS